MVSVALSYVQLYNTFIKRSRKFANGKTKITKTFDFFGS